MHRRLLGVLACPVCMGSLDKVDGSLVCTRCRCAFPAEKGPIHFVHDEDRPHNPKNLAKLSDIRDPKTYERNARRNEKSYATDADVREFVDFVVACRGIIVDLATGPGGGYIAPMLKRISSEALLIATDACLPVIEFQYKLFKPKYRDQFEMLDVDLGRTLPFKKGSIGLFCGLAITNISEVSTTLREVVRCLEPHGKLIIGERFYPQQSATAQYLSGRGHAFASFESFESYCEQIGLRVTRFDELFSRKGKSDPRDGLPIEETDEWFWCHIYLEKRTDPSE